jgi:hypothetical protein
VELDDRLGGAALSKPTRLSPKAGWLSPETGWISRLLGADRNTRFVLEPRQVPADVLGDRRDFALLEFDADGRPVLQVLPGMLGELRIGVSRMTVAQMLADPALRLAEGGARLPLPNGARVRIACGSKTFLARVGGPPLVMTLQPAAGHSQLAHA